MNEQRGTPARARVWAVALWLGLLGLPFGVLGGVNGLRGPADHAATEACSRVCHDARRGCRHTAARIDFERPAAAFARRVFLTNVRLLGSTPLGYQNTNLVVYVLGFPSLNAGLLLACLWPLPGRPTSTVHKVATLGAWGLGIALLGLVVVTGGLARWGLSARGLYWYCTDFCIHAANLTSIPYDAFNFLLFTVAFPLTAATLGLGVVWRLWRRWTHRRSGA